MKLWRKSKKFVCSCGKDFNKIGQYKRHLKDAHDIDYIKPNKEERQPQKGE